MSRTSQDPIARPSALACVECRSKHLKCDSRQPICSRCSDFGTPCSYTPSRRGCKGQPKKRRKLNPTMPQETSASSIKPQDPSDHSSHTGDLDGPPVDDTEVSTAQMPITAVRETQVLPALEAEQIFALTQGQYQEVSLSGLDDEHIVNLYYTNFHPAHPILLPRGMYHSQNYPAYLKRIVQFIGSHYSSSHSGNIPRLDVVMMLEDQTEASPFMVQARLLYAIALHARNETTEAQTMLSSAIDLALVLGMNTSKFATNHSSQQPAMKESLRRTWWELYITEGYMSAIHRKALLRCNGVTMDASLPCEESAYADGACDSANASLAQFNNRHFADEDMDFSSFCYRIEAMQILSRVLSVSNSDAHADEVQAIDNSLAAWTHYLPIARHEVIGKTGQVDEMLFQAHMIINWATILLHLPRSGLLSILPATTDIFCAKGGKPMCPTDTKHAHAVKAIDASKDLANLAAIRCSVQRHSPFFICSLVLASVVQLAACVLHACRCTSQHRDRVTLVVGVLKSFSFNWTIASAVVTKVKKIAAQVFRTDLLGMSTANSVHCTSCTDAGVAMSSGMEDISWVDFLDDPAVLAFEKFAPGLLFSEEGA